MTAVIGLLDCNNFYASCERVFNPAWRKKPIVVLSNNDGCIIARSQEAKELGIEMGEPVFKCRQILETNNVIQRSSNFTLYSDLSQRVMTILAQELGDIDVYSIDEAFLYFGESENLDPKKVLARAEKLSAKIERDTGIPVSIGIATSKTLCKIANRIAKKNRIKGSKNNAFSFFFGEEDKELVQAKLDYHLADFPVEDIWGIGRSFRHFLHAHGIYRALDLKYANHYWIKQEMKVNGLRTVIELSGLPCIPMTTIEDDQSDTKSIISSRSFGHRVSSRAELEEALANFVSTAAYKLRRAKKTCGELQVFLRAPFGIGSPKGAKFNQSIKITPTDSSPKLIRAAHKALAQIFHEEACYKKAGVTLYELKDIDSVQVPLLLNSEVEKFSNRFDKDRKIGELVDSFNDEFGRNSLFWASMGKKQENSHWKAKQNLRSPCFTTEWAEIPKVH